MRERFKIAIAAVCLVLPPATHGQPTPASSYPAKPIRMIVPFAPGATASSEQVSRLWDANVREPGADAVELIAVVASVFGVASPEGAPAPAFTLPPSISQMLRCVRMRP